MKVIALFNVRLNIKGEIILIDVSIKSKAVFRIDEMIAKLLKSVS